MQIRAETEDSFHASDHNGGGGAGQPVDVGTAEVFAGFSLSELPIAVRFQTTDIRPVILGGRGVFHKIGKSPFSMPAQRFRQNKPSLGLGKDTRVFFCSLVINYRQRTLKGMGMIRRIHQNGPIRRIQILVYVI